MKKEKKRTKNWLLVGLLSSTVAFSYERGIYINQKTAEDTAYLGQLIKKAKATDVNTFVMDLERVGTRYKANLQMVQHNGLRVVSRIVVFPNGGATTTTMHSKVYWDRRLQLLKTAVGLHVNAIQLDYMRYTTRQAASVQNADDVKQVVCYYKRFATLNHVPLQVDVFGISAHAPELHIGQDVTKIGACVDAMCPMVYPSHYEPYKEHAVTPFKTILTSLTLLNKKFNGDPPFHVIPYIELFNFRHAMSNEQRLRYIDEQIRAVHDGEGDGYYVWSASNQYDNLFKVLALRHSYANTVYTSTMHQIS